MRSKLDLMEKENRVLQERTQSVGRPRSTQGQPKRLPATQLPSPSHAKTFDLRQQPFTLMGPEGTPPRNSFMEEMNRFLNQTCNFGEGSHQQRKKPQFHLDLSKVVSTEQLVEEGKHSWKTKYLS